MNRRLARKALLVILALGWTAAAQSPQGAAPPANDPWTPGELLQPQELARAIQSGHAPIILSAAFPVLYRGKHIVHAINAGPTSKPEGIEALKNAVANLPKDADLVIYCGCCPMVKCPNIRPAYRTLKELGFTHVRVLNLETNLHEDWVAKGYPAEGAASSKN
jgi:thiosulfate/3-mercaptopyruvate sulfurtransferase